MLCHLTALLPESDLAEHLLPSANAAHYNILIIYNYTCHSTMIVGGRVLTVDLIISHCLWEISVIHLSLLF